MVWMFGWVWLAGCWGPSEPGPCIFAGCDELCVEEGSDWVCGDTAAAYEVCYDEDFQVCERQPDGECGWTMVDQAGWDQCVADSKAG